MPTDKPLVSILTTSYNYGRYIGQTIQSVLNQTYENWEMIVSDDASTDNSLEVIRSFADPRITLITSAQNEGGPANRAKAYALCKGKYLNTLNSDDYIAPDKLEKQVAYLEAQPEVDILSTFVTEIDESEQPSGDKAWLEPIFNQGLDLNDAENLVWNRICHSSVLMRKAVHERVGWFNRDLIYLPDHEFWVRCLIQGAKFYTLPEKLTYYRTHQQNMSKGKNPDRFAAEFAFIFCVWLKPYLLKLNRYNAISTAVYSFLQYEYYQDKPASKNIKAQVLQKLIAVDDLDPPEFLPFWNSIQSIPETKSLIEADIFEMLIKQLLSRPQAYQAENKHFVNLEASIAGLKADVSHLEQLIASKESYVGHLEQLVATKESHNENLEKRLAAIEQTKVWQLRQTWHNLKHFLIGSK